MKELVERVNPFDPTKSYSVKERERLSKMRFLPDLPQDLLSAKKSVQKKQTVASHIVSPKKTLRDADKSFQDKFPKQVLLEAQACKTTLRINPKARYLMKLHDDALKNKKIEDEELQKRRLETIDKYDWDLVKKIGQEQPFQRYIEALMMKGLQEQEATTIKTNSQTEDIVIPEETVALVDFDDYAYELIEHYHELLATSPFRIKPKGAPSRPKFFNDIDHETWRYGRPIEFCHNEAKVSEFQRAFTDLEELGDNILAKEKYLALDAESFEVAKTIALAIEAIRKNSQESSKLERKNGKKSSGGTFNESGKHKFDEDRIFLQKQLIKFLVTRNRKKLENNLSIKKMAKIEAEAMRNAAKHINTNNVHSSIPTHNIWLNKSHSTTLLNVVEIMPPIYK